MHVLGKWYRDISIPMIHSSAIWKHKIENHKAKVYEHEEEIVLEEEDSRPYVAHKNRE